MHLIINFLIYFLVFTNSTLSLSPSQRHGVMDLSLSLSHSRLSLSFLLFFSFFPSFLAFLFGFGVLLTARFSSFFFFFFFLFYTHTHTHTHTHTYIYIYIYIYFKVFMGSWKLLGWLAGTGMGEVRGAQAKNQGAQAFFMKILYTKKKKFLDPGGARAPFALCLGPSLYIYKRKKE